MDKKSKVTLYKGGQSISVAASRAEHYVKAGYVRQKPGTDAPRGGKGGGNSGGPPNTGN